jgi:hypothetical protein
MRTPDEVAAMLRLEGVGLGRAADRDGFGMQPAAGGWVSYRRLRRRNGSTERLGWRSVFCHRGNADVVRQDLEREQGASASLRTVAAGGGRSSCR